MKHALLIPFAATFLLASSFAQDRIYRCGNEYTNTVPAGQKSNCKLIEGGNVTVVQSQRPTASGAPVRVATAAQSGQRIDAPEQRSRDSDAKQILESELKRSQSRREELLKEYNNGEPEKLGPETRNHQKYLDRVAELKANIDRNDSDISGIQREIGRVAPANNPAAKY
jgi:hypothetical protein